MNLVARAGGAGEPHANPIEATRPIGIAANHVFTYRVDEVVSVLAKKRAPEDEDGREAVAAMLIRMMLLGALLPLAACSIRSGTDDGTRAAAYPEADMDHWLRGKPSRDFTWPADARVAIPVAVDHVAVMVVKRGWGGGGDDRLAVSRSGRWLREDLVERGRPMTTMSDLRSGISFRYAARDGRYRSLMVRGTSQAARITVDRTDRTDRLLGENCTVWRFSRDGIVEEMCLTHDGIALWTRVKGSGGNELGASRAESIVRRPLTPAEVQLPPDLLRLSSWTDKRNGPSASTPNDEVLLALPQSGALAARRTVTTRRRGVSRSVDDRLPNGRRRHYVGADFTVAFDEGPGGVLQTLAISAIDPRQPALANEGVRIGESGTKTILGEMCTMFDAAPHVSDYDLTECRSADGAVLEMSERSWGADLGPLVATRISRGKLSAADMLPPDDLFGAARWFDGACVSCE